MLTIPWFVTKTVQDLFRWTPAPLEVQHQQTQQHVQVQHQQQQHTQVQQQQRGKNERGATQQQVEQKSLLPTKVQQTNAAAPREGSSPTSRKPTTTPVSTVTTQAKTAIPVSTDIIQAKSASPQHSAPPGKRVENLATLQLAKAAPIVDGKPSAEPSLHTSSRIFVLTNSSSEGRMSFEWAQQQIEKFKFDFDEADKDKSGTLSFDEVLSVLKKVGFKGSKEEAKFIFGHLDRDKDQKVTKEEFTATLNKLPRLSIKEFALRKAFLKLDKDGSGYLSRSEIEDATKSEAGLDIAAEKISDLLIYLCKEDEDGKVSYEEFLQVFGVESAATVMRQVFAKLDSDGSGYLSKEEILAAVKAEFELKLKAEKISDLLCYWCKDEDKKISYKEFVDVWLKQKAEKPGK